VRAVRGPITKKNTLRRSWTNFPGRRTAHSVTPFGTYSRRVRGFGEGVGPVSAVAFSSASGIQSGRTYQRTRSPWVLVSPFDCSGGIQAESGKRSGEGLLVQPVHPRNRLVSLQGQRLRCHHFLPRKALSGFAAYDQLRDD
jgi:hypothetical protein